MTEDNGHEFGCDENGRLWVPERNLLSNSVSKKGELILAWAMMMPHNHCPFASEVCKRLCYTFVGNFPLQDGRHKENYEFSKSPLFVEAITKEICRFAIENRNRDVAVAIHERGEFYGLEYLAKWAEIIFATRRIGNLTFFIYTRSWRNPMFREALERLAADNRHVRINLSLDSDMVARFGVPKPIGDGRVVYLAETDDDLPPAGADLVLRNLRIRHDKPMERIGGVLVCPNESGLYVAKRQGEPSLRKGVCKRIECQSCRLCIDRSEQFWEAVKGRYAGTPGEPVMNECSGADVLNVPKTITLTNRVAEFSVNASQLKAGRPTNKPPYTVLELFSGCGGMSTGFEMAGLDVVCASDSWPVAAETYRRNHPNTQFVLGDICSKEVKSNIVNIFKDRECDILAGGFPCVAFSMSGKRDPEDPRGRLFEDFLDMVRLMQPKIVVGENVVGIKSAIHPREPYWDINAPWLKSVVSGSYEATLLDHAINETVGWKIIRRLGELGYCADCLTLNAADFGVPQSRKRVIFIAVRNDLLLAEDFPEPTHGPGLIPYMTVRDAIGDLANLPENEAWSHVFTTHSSAFIERIRKTLVGTSVNPRFRESWFRQPPDEPAKTVKANNGGVFLHYEQDRVMTPRELARLQSFPDNYQFRGCKGDILKQIGNAVPLLLAKAIGIRLRQMLYSAEHGSNGQIA